MSSPQPEEKAIVRHTLTVYNALLEEAKQEGDFLIFRGKITHVFARTGIGQSYYTKVFKQLEGQGCIHYLQRGTRAVDTVLALEHPPTPEATLPPPKSPLTDPERYANLSEDVEALKILVGGVNIVSALMEVEKRLHKVEESIAARDSVTSSNIVQQQGE